MKPFDLSQYMFSVAQAAGAGLMGYDAAIDYAAGTVGAAIKAGGGGGGGLPASTMAQFNTACTDGDFAFLSQPANFTGPFTVAATTTAINIGTTNGTFNLGPDQLSGAINIGGFNAVARISLGTSQTSQTVAVATGSTISGQTKTIEIGPNGMNGSTTNITYGSGTGGAVSNHVFNGAVSSNAGGSINFQAGTLNASIGATTGSTNLGISQTTGQIVLGGTTATGSINIGRSSANQSVDIASGGTASGSTKTVNIANGALAGSTTILNMATSSGQTNVNLATGVTPSGAVKIVNIGTSGASGSTTNITYGSAVAGATSNHAFNGGSIVLVGRSNNQFAGYSVRSTYASASQAATNFVDFQNELSIPVAAEICTLSIDGSSNLDWYTTPAGARNADRRVRALSLGPTSELVVFGSTIWVGNGANALWQHDGTNTYFRGQNAGGQMYLGTGAANRVVLDHAVFAPVADNVHVCGWSGARWASVWAVNGAIQTSDGREKEWKGSLTSAEMAASKEIANSIGKYQWLHSIEEKGGEARLHIGVIAQNIIEIMAEHDLDAFRYGFVCHDEWEEKSTPQSDPVDPTKNIDVVTPAGDRFSVRYDELAMFIAAAQQQKQDELEARIAALEG